MSRGPVVVGSTARVQELIAELVRARTVLDVGCVDHTATEADRETWLHAHIVRSAASVLGIDLVDHEVARLRERGYHVLCADAMHLDLGESFEVITAGELLEHLDEPGPFLRSMHRHLTDDGRLILTTPHVFFAYHVLEFLLTRPAGRWNPEHVAWYEPFTLRNLLERNGFAMTHCLYVTRSRRLRWLLRTLHLPCRPLLASTLLVVAEKRPLPA